MLQSVKDLIKHVRAYFWRKRTLAQRIYVPTEPHLDEDATPFFRERLAQAKFYLEFGSGGSTILADRLGVKTISIESDEYFAAAVRNVLMENSAVTLLHANIGATQAWGYPVATHATKARLARWRCYTTLAFKAVDEVGGFPDFVMIDGRFRRACAMETARQALNKGKPVTIFVDDYAHRPQYSLVEQHLGKPKMVGRAALFEIGTQSVNINISDDDIASAHADFR